MKIEIFTLILCSLVIFTGGCLGSSALPPTTSTTTQDTSSTIMIEYKPIANDCLIVDVTNVGRSHLDEVVVAFSYYDSAGVKIRNDVQTVISLDPDDTARIRSPMYHSLYPEITRGGVDNVGVYIGNKLYRILWEEKATTTPASNPKPSGTQIASYNGGFGFDPTTGTIYKFTGDISINSGVYNSVQVIIRYPDSQIYNYDAGPMGGSNPTIKPFYIYPDSRYKDKVPTYYIKLDDNKYSMVEWEGAKGTTWTAYKN